MPFGIESDDKTIGYIQVVHGTLKVDPCVRCRDMEDGERKQVGSYAVSDLHQTSGYDSPDRDH